MFENQNLSEIKDILKIKLKDYELFKKYIEIINHTLGASLLIYSLSFVLLVINFCASDNLMKKYNIPSRYFLKVFFDSSNSQNLMFKIVSLTGIAGLIIATILLILNLLTREAKIKKIHKEFLESDNSIIFSKELIKLQNSYYLLFKNEDDAEKMLDLIKSNAFENDETYNKIVNCNRFNIQKNYSKLSNHLKKNYGFKSVIKNVLYDSFEYNILKCKSQYYNLFIKSHILHLILINKIIQDKI